MWQKLCLNTLNRYGDRAPETFLKITLNGIVKQEQNPLLRGWILLLTIGKEYNIDLDRIWRSIITKMYSLGFNVYNLIIC